MVERPIKPGKAKRPPLEPDEKANVLTHAFGLLLGLVLTPFILYRAQAEAAHFWGVVVFMLSLLAVYSSSTIYHSARDERSKYLLRKVDHICIYFLIAGTHTPFLLIYLPNTQGYTYLAILWGLVLFGIFYKLFFFDKWEWFSLALYLGMGWMAIFTLPPMLDQMPSSSLYWIIFGGISYTVGVYFYARSSIKYYHAIWHLFVIGGSAGHFMGVWEALQDKFALTNLVLKRRSTHRLAPSAWVRLFALSKSFHHSCHAKTSRLNSSMDYQYNGHDSERVARQNTV